MTPLASQIMQQCLDNGDQEGFDEWCQYQWCEITDIAPLAEMAHDEDLFSYGIGELAPWPTERLMAPNLWLECELVALTGGIKGRIGIALRENMVPEWCLNWEIFTGFKGVDPISVSSGSLWPGTQWFDTSRTQRKQINADLVFAGVALQAVRILNIPNLITFRKRKNKKHLKGVARGRVDFFTWSEVKINHKAVVTPKNSNYTGPIMPLHYVRGHHSPSVGVDRWGFRHWIEGYWRGDVSLGINLKNYKGVITARAISETLGTAELRKRLMA